MNAEFCHMLSLHLLTRSYGFCLLLLIDFQILSQPGIPEIMPFAHDVLSVFYIDGVDIVNISKDFCIYVHEGY